MQKRPKMGQQSEKRTGFKKDSVKYFEINEITDTYMRNDKLKKTGQLRKVRVEFGFGTVCLMMNRMIKMIGSS